MFLYSTHCLIFLILFSARFRMSTLLAAISNKLLILLRVENGLLSSLFQLGVAVICSTNYCSISTKSLLHSGLYLLTSWALVSSCCYFSLPLLSSHNSFLNSCVTGLSPIHTKNLIAFSLASYSIFLYSRVNFFSSFESPWISSWCSTALVWE